MSLEHDRPAQEHPSGPEPAATDAPRPSLGEEAVPMRSDAERDLERENDERMRAALRPARRPRRLGGGTGRRPRVLAGLSVVAVLLLVAVAVFGGTDSSPAPQPDPEQRTASAPPDRLRPPTAFAERNAAERARRRADLRARQKAARRRARGQEASRTKAAAAEQRPAQPAAAESAPSPPPVSEPVAESLPEEAVPTGTGQIYVPSATATAQREFGFER